LPLSFSDPRVDPSYQLARAMHASVPRIQGSPFAGGLFHPSGSGRDGSPVTSISLPFPPLRCGVVVIAVEEQEKVVFPPPAHRLFDVAPPSVVVHVPPARVFVAGCFASVPLPLPISLSSSFLFVDASISLPVPPRNGLSAPKLPH